jgi:hypothetical protein
MAISCVLVLKVQTEERGRKSKSTPAGGASNRLRRGRGCARKRLLWLSQDSRKALGRNEVSLVILQRFLTTRLDW